MKGDTRMFDLKIFKESDFTDSEINNKIDDFKEFVDEKMPGMVFESSTDGYSVTSITLRCKKNQENKLCLYNNNRFAIAVGAIFDNSNVAMSIKGNRLIIDIGRNEKPTLRIGNGLKILREIPKEHVSAQVYIGERASGENCIVSLNNTNPHLIAAGNSGAGKSILIHNILLSLADRYTDKEVNVYGIDIKNETFKGYFENTKSIFKREESKPTAIYDMLEDIDNEFSRRKRLRDSLDTYTNGIEDYNNIVRTKDKWPLIVLIIDEADALFIGKDDNEYGKKIRTVITSMAKEYRSLGLRLILISQRPTGKTIGTDLRDQCGTRIALKLEKEASRMILNNTNATKLSLGGDAIMHEGNDIDIRLQTALVEREEIIKAQKMIKNG